MNKTKGAWRRMRLALAFSAVIFLIILLTMMVVYAGMYMFSYLGIPIMDSERFPMFYFSLASLIVGTAIAFLTSSLPLRPIRKVMDATDRIAGGDYSVRLDERGNSDFRELYRKFNHMAAELGSVEMLRTNFVNDFSHEFKTPIVSIRGFAKILKQDDLTVQERDEYLDIIIQESERLAELSANVLKLSRIEQQTILTDQKKYNLSEQIRGSIAMMDNKWNQKQMDFQMYGSETYLMGNAELLKEVWLNLLDNAIKFSPDGGTVKIVVRQYTEYVEVEVSNPGEPIAEETARHIFDRFYQGDASHTTKGNGLGLTIASKIVELHKGEITMDCSKKGWVTFTVRIPEAHEE